RRRRQQRARRRRARPPASDEGLSRRRSFLRRRFLSVRRGLAAFGLPALRFPAFRLLALGFSTLGLCAFGLLAFSLLSFGSRLLNRNRRSVGQASLSVDDDLLAGFHALPNLGVQAVSNADDDGAALGLVAFHNEDRGLLAFANERSDRNENDIGVLLRIDLDLNGCSNREGMSRDEVQTHGRRRGSSLD